MENIPRISASQLCFLSALQKLKECVIIYEMPLYWLLGYCLEGWQGTVEPLRLLGHSTVDFCFMATRISIFKIDRAGCLYSVLAKSKMVTFSHDAPSVLSWEPHCVTCSTELGLAYLSTTDFQVRRAKLVP